jgi:hypothetical protein
MTGLLASLVVLLFAAAGLARHIWLQRASRKPPQSTDPAPGAAEETDIEVES